MKAISLWEPWASLIRTGAKTWETRSWAANYRGPLLICAAIKGLSDDELISFLCRGDIQAGLAPLVGKSLNLCPPDGVFGWSGVKTQHLHFGKAVAIVNLTRCIPTSTITLGEIATDRSYGDFSLGRFAWKLESLQNHFAPFPIKGKQGFFEVDDALIRQHVSPIESQA